MEKSILIKTFQKDAKKYWEVELFKEKGFARKQCENCKKYFWTLDPDRKICADSSCEPYGFINNTITKGKWDYIDTWKIFEKYFVKEGHEPIKRYPVIDRVRPDLYFTIASIQDFQRLDNGNMVFVYPANPLVVPQVSLRFVDIPSVGLSGRHLTSFIMGGQHAFGYPKEGYFKDRCMELNFGFLNGVMGIPEKELVYAEDVWAMPGAFGPSIETFSKGLELVNHVFMQFQPTDSGFKELPIKVVDTGWGGERLVWFSNGTHTMYDCIFGNLIDRLKKQGGIKLDPAVFSNYSKLAGALDIEELTQEKAKKTREDIAKKLGVSASHLRDQIEPMQAIYAIADHIRTLLFAITDGGIPSNIGGGYNLRVILRRALWFIKEYNFDFDLLDIAEKHAQFLKPLFPELKEGLPVMEKILPIEKQKYEGMQENAKKIVEKIIANKEELTEEKLIQLYESHGITPELIGKTAGVDVPIDIYSRITERHEIAEIEKPEKKIDVIKYPETRLLFYEDHTKKEFSAKVLGAGENYVILSQTCFYPEGGGQEADSGEIEGHRVYDVKKIGNVVAHFLENPDFHVGQQVNGRIDWERREQLIKHHTGIHILGAATRKVLGRHVFQAGTHKSFEKAHLDITHYKAIEKEEADRIEKEANDIVKKSIEIKKTFFERSEAEKKYGTQIYQGGVVPGRQVRIVEIEGEDIQACGGTHADTTKEVGQIVIISTERIQDGVNRITIKAGEQAEKYLEESFVAAKNIIEIIKSLQFLKLPERFEKGLKKETAYKELRDTAEIFSVPQNQLVQTIKRFVKEIQEDQKTIFSLEAKTGIKPKQEISWEADDLKNTSKIIFDVWKSQKKRIENLRRDFAVVQAEELMKKAKKDIIFEIMPTERKAMIDLATAVLSKNPRLTIVLANINGELVCMSRTRDMDAYIKELCKKAGGSGGGTKELAQGKTDLSKLRKLMV